MKKTKYLIQWKYFKTGQWNDYSMIYDTLKEVRQDFNQYDDSVKRRIIKRITTTQDIIV